MLRGYWWQLIIGRMSHVRLLMTQEDERMDELNETTPYIFIEKIGLYIIAEVFPVLIYLH